MRAAAIALVLSILAVVILGLSDALNAWLVGGPIVLLLSIPISLSLFTFLSHRQQEEDSSR